MKKKIIITLSIITIITIITILTAIILNSENVVGYQVDDTLHIFIKGTGADFIPELTEEPSKYFFPRGYLPIYRRLEEKGMNKIIIHSGVTSLEGFIFCTDGLQEIKLPETLEIIGENTFRGSHRGNNLESIIIPDSVTYIGDRAFSDNRLEEVIIPDSVTYIGDRAFSHNRLEEVIIPDSVTYIGDGAFNGNNLKDVVLPNEMEYIKEVLFSSNRLKNIKLPENLKRIDRLAFEGNILEEITLPDSVTYIGDGAFYNNRLEEVIIPDSVTYIGRSAFSDNRLKEVIIPNSVTYIGPGAFGRNNLREEDIILGEGLKDYFVYDKEDPNKLISHITEENIDVLIVPENVTSIKSSSFCFSSINKIVIGDNVKITDNINENKGFYKVYNENGMKAGTYIWNGNNWELKGE